MELKASRHSLDSPKTKGEGGGEEQALMAMEVEDCRRRR